MCFAPQRRALSERLNFQKCSGPEALCTFWLRSVLHATRACCFRTSRVPKVLRTWFFVPFWLPNVLRATTACAFWKPQLPKVLQAWGVFSIMTLKCASRHCNFSSLLSPAGSAPAALASLLFDPPEPQIIGKTQCFATFLPFRAPASSFFWLSLSSLIFFLLPFSSLTLLTSAFPSVHIVRSLTSKLPSIIILHITSYNYLVCSFMMFYVMNRYIDFYEHATVWGHPTGNIWNVHIGWGHDFG